jgi:hypothetical protein
MNEFGSCCKDLAEAISLEKRKSFFRMEENGVLYLTIGYLTTKDGTGWFDMAVIYCPFCGSKIQHKESLKS